MVRQSLDADSAYADVALQWQRLDVPAFREEKGAQRMKFRRRICSKLLRIEKRGAYFGMSLAGADGDFHLAGGSTRITLKEPFMWDRRCSHDRVSWKKPSLEC